MTRGIPMRVYTDCAGEPVETPRAFQRNSCDAEASTTEVVRCVRASKERRCRAAYEDGPTSFNAYVAPAPLLS